VIQTSVGAKLGSDANGASSLTNKAKAF